MTEVVIPDAGLPQTRWHSSEHKADEDRVGSSPSCTGHTSQAVTQLLAPGPQACQVIRCALL